MAGKTVGELRFQGAAPIGWQRRPEHKRDLELSLRLRELFQVPPELVFQCREWGNPIEPDVSDGYILVVQLDEWARLATWDAHVRQRLNCCRALPLLPIGGDDRRRNESFLRDALRIAKAIKSLH